METDVAKRQEYAAGRTRIRKFNQEIIFGYLFILPTICAFLVFQFVPTVSVFVLSLFQWDLINQPKFIGLDNYSKMFQSRDYWHVLWVTVQYVLLSQPLKTVLALLLALLLYRPLKGIQWIRVPIIIPWITTPIAIAIVWKWILDPGGGLLNYYLGILGLDRVNWFSPFMALKSIALIDIWNFTGFTSLLFLIGLQNIDRTYYEAADIDGAGALRKFWHITLPLLRPTMLFVFIISIIGSFQVFDIVYATTEGGPGDLTKVYYYAIYDKAFGSLQMGYASALCVVLFVMLMSLTVIQLRIFRDNTNH